MMKAGGQAGKSNKMKKIASVLHSAQIQSVAIALILITSGGALMARPAWHWGLRQYVALKADAIWRHAKPSSQSGAPALWLTIPKRGIDTLVIRNATPENLKRFPCLESENGLPLILAHRDTHFHALQYVQVNDLIKIAYPNGIHRKFRISKLEILDSDQVRQRIHEDHSSDKLALMTCHPFNYIGPAPNRLVVWANSTEE